MREQAQAAGSKDDLVVEDYRDNTHTTLQDHPKVFEMEDENQSVQEHKIYESQQIDKGVIPSPQHSVRSDHMAPSNIFIPQDKSPQISTLPSLNEENKDVKWSSTSSESSTSSADFQHFVSVENCEKVVRKKHILQKLVFTITIVTMVMLTVAIVRFQWLLPYYYAISAPILIVSRAIMYWKFKWQYFLIDFCYFGNTLVYVYLWAVPTNKIVFSVIFGIANGPLAWAIAMFRNSLVFHSTDKMTSTFIHILPLLLTYGVRWFPDTISMAWYTDFVSDFDESVGEMFLWVVAVPYACFLIHSLMYMFVVYCVLKPSEEYLNSHRYISAKKVFSPCINMLGPNCDKVTYTLFNNIYALLSFLLTPLWFSFFMAHTVFICLTIVIITWNGASYYMDVFALKGHKAEMAE